MYYTIANMYQSVDAPLTSAFRLSDGDGNKDSLIHFKTLRGTVKIIIRNSTKQLGTVFQIDEKYSVISDRNYVTISSDNEIYMFEYTHIVEYLKKYWNESGGQMPNF